MPIFTFIGLMLAMQVVGIEEPRLWSCALIAYVVEVQADRIVAALDRRK